MVTNQTHSDRYYFVVQKKSIDTISVGWYEWKKLLKRTSNPKQIDLFIDFGKIVYLCDSSSHYFIAYIYNLQLFGGMNSPTLQGQCKYYVSFVRRFLAPIKRIEKPRATEFKNENKKPLYINILFFFLYGVKHFVRFINTKIRIDDEAAAPRHYHCQHRLESDNIFVSHNVLFLSIRIASVDDLTLLRRWPIDISHSHILIIPYHIILSIGPRC